MESIIQNVWSRSRSLVKALIITLIFLLLQLPAYYVKNLIEEREGRQKEAIAEVSSKWAGRQNIAGPIIGLPYLEYSDTSINKAGKKHVAYFLPDELTVNSTVIPQEKY